MWSCRQTPALEGSGRHSLPVYRLPPDIIGRRLGLGLRVGSDIYYYRFYTYIYIYATGHAETRTIRKTNPIQLYSARFSLCILNSYSFEPIFRTIFPAEKNATLPHRRGLSRRTKLITTLQCGRMIRHSHTHTRSDTCEHRLRKNPFNG